MTTYDSAEKQENIFYNVSYKNLQLSQTPFQPHEILMEVIACKVYYDDFKLGHQNKFADYRGKIYDLFI